MTPNHLHILQHSLGCDEYGRSERIYPDEGDGRMGFYRNRYVCDPEPDLIELCRLGYMKDCGPMEIAANMHCYMVTREGREAMYRESPAPPKVSLSRQRYLDYLHADSGWSFGEWLKYGGYKPA